MSVNKVVLVGHVGSVSHASTKTGVEVVTLRLATGKKYTDKTTGEKVEKTEWHTVKVLGSSAVNAQKLVVKGQLLYVEGELQHREYVDKNQVTRQVVEVLALDWQLLGKRVGQPVMQQSLNEPAPNFVGGVNDYKPQPSGAV